MMDKRVKLAFSRLSVWGAVAMLVLVLSANQPAHYPRHVQFIGNHCRDGRQNSGETGIDQGGPCP
jgi:hypothetical protein